MPENILQKKSYDFALKIIILYGKLSEKEKYFPLMQQLIRSSTSIGANVEESIGAQSRADFFSKLYIAYKEARETEYWLRLLRDSEILEARIANNLILECVELLKILGKIRIKK
jgi:four helix bundle protein